VAKWESELKKNPVFQEEFKKEEKYLRNYDGARPCGKIFTQFGLHGNSYELYDAAVDGFNGIDHLGDTDFGNDELMSMMPYENCYIRAYQHSNREGYSNICSETYGCSVVPSYNQGALPENEATSVYCYCDAPKPKQCGTIFKNDGDDTWEEGYATIFDGAKLGFEWSLDEPTQYVSNDDLSLINAFGGCQVDIWEDRHAGGDHFTCPGLDNGNWCHHSSLGYVGNDEATTISCTCPVDFDYIEYDVPQDQWDSIGTDTSAPARQIDKIELVNSCNLDPDRCSDTMLTLDPTRSITTSSSHNWGHIFKAGVSYTAGASASFEGMGIEESITISADTEDSEGGSHEKTETMSATGSCKAPPNSKAHCLYMAYQTEIKVGYTIHWKNSSPTRGTYQAVGWYQRFTNNIEDL